MEEQRESSSKEGYDFKRLKPPNRKKYEEDLDALLSKIHDLEAQLNAAKTVAGGRSLRNIRDEKEATFDRNKKINSELKILNQEISAKIYTVTQMQSMLVYKNEDKCNDAIRKLQLNLVHHSYRLTEERKIVAEIDKLKRSKINICAFNSAKSQLDELRGKQRRMREERDHYSKTITNLRAQEDETKRRLSSNRGQTEALKREIDEQYQAKRKLVEYFKRSQVEFQEATKKRRQESFKKKEEERKAILEAKQREEEELEQLRVPYDSECQLCYTLISYLKGLSYPQPIESPQSTNDKTQPITPTNNQNQGAISSGPAAELEDGNLILLRKSDDNDFIGGNVRKQNKKPRKSRKPSMTKLITHCPQVISQFASLNLSAPCTAYEIPASLEQLRARKLYYEQKVETQSNISLTESGICEMSRQASNTESCGSACETRAPEHIFEELLSEKNCCPEFPPEVDSFIPQLDGQSTYSSDTPRNLSVSSGSVLSTDVEEIDSSNGQSLENSGHLSHIDQSDTTLDCVNKVLTTGTQSETVSHLSANEKIQLNQSVALSQRENNIDKRVLGNGILDHISEQEEIESQDLKQRNAWGIVNASLTERERESICCESICCESVVKVNTSAMDSDNEKVECDLETTHL